MNLTPYKEKIYYIILIILILSIIYYFLNIEKFSEEIISSPMNTRGLNISLTPNGMNFGLNWFGNKSDNLLEQSNWKCSSSLGSIRSIRKTSEGIIQCAGINTSGAINNNSQVKCVKHINNIDCLNYNKLQNEKLNPVICKSEITSNYDSKHWCSVGSQKLQNEISPSNWSCTATADGDIRSIRKNSKGNIECASNDRQNCIIHSTNEKCTNYNKTKNENESVIPYSCPPMRDTNNDNLSDWCAQGYKELLSSY